MLHEAVEIQKHLAAQDAVLQQLIAEAKAAASAGHANSGAGGALGATVTAEA